MREPRRRIRLGHCLAFAGAMGLLLAVAGTASAQSGAGVVPTPSANWGPPTAIQETVTYAADVAPILQENCVICHRPGSIGPMPLETYEQVKQFAPLIRYRVMNRIMPPWPIDKGIGIQQFKNDRSLTDGEIETIVRWVDAGAPLGDAAAVPPVREWPDWEHAWKYTAIFDRPPDLIVRSPAYVVEANGMDQNPPMQTKIEGITGERWIRAIEIRPGNPETRMVFHHANSSLVVPGQRADDERAELAASALGMEGFIYPEDTGRPISPGSSISFGMHLVPTDHPVEAVLELAFWFHEGKPQFETPGEQILRISQTTGNGNPFPGHSTNPQISGNWPDLVIPPNSIATYRGTWVLDKAARLFSLRGHFHYRAKYAVLEAIYPDGRREVINRLNWQHQWHVTFLYEDEVMPLLPKGTTLLATAVVDNTADNPTNPDPDQWVTWGPRTVDEMTHVRVGITWLEDGDFERLIAERQRRAPVAAADR